MSLPLAGVRALDLSNVLAGPFCAYHLARLGAEVVKVENPDGGDLARRLGADPAMAERLEGLSFIAVNAGKCSVALDLKSPAGKALFLKMAARADVVLENFRPGVMQRLGIDYPVLSQINPRLVYCAISGFGQGGPWAARPAYDQIVQGLSGAMSITGDAGAAPLRVGFPMSDTLAGLTAAFAIAAALVDQRQSGRGRFIDVSLLESTLAAMGWVVSNHLNADVEPRPVGNDNPSASPSGTFRTASGPLNIAANEQKQFDRLCELVERPELRGDPRFAAREARKLHRAELTAALEEALAARPAADWERMLNENGVPAGRVLGLPEILAHDQVAGRNFVETIEMSRGDGRRLRITRPGFLIEGGFAAPTPPPRLGADTRAWLEALGIGAAELDALIAAGAVGVEDCA